ncbi:hypothetical protein [Lentzea sp. E54]
MRVETNGVFAVRTRSGDGRLSAANRGGGPFVTVETTPDLAE